MDKLISRRYASALFELAQETGNIDLFDEQIKLIYEAIKDDSEFKAVLNHPQISGDEKLKLLIDVFKDKAVPDILGFFSVVFNKNREAEFIEILKVFIERVEAHRGITTAVLSSAEPLSEEQQSKIKEKLSKNLNKQVNIQTEVSPELIGGVRIRVDGHVIDGTIKKQLDDMKKQLLNMQPAQ